MPDIRSATLLDGGAPSGLRAKSSTALVAAVKAAAACASSSSNVLSAATNRASKARAFSSATICSNGCEPNCGARTCPSSAGVHPLWDASSAMASTVCRAGPRLAAASLRASIWASTAVPRWLPVTWSAADRADAPSPCQWAIAALTSLCAPSSAVVNVRLSDINSEAATASCEGSVALSCVSVTTTRPRLRSDPAERRSLGRLPRSRSPRCSPWSTCPGGLPPSRRRPA